MQAYKMKILMDETNKKCRVTEVKNVLSRNSLYCVWLQQGVGDENNVSTEFKQRFTDIIVQKRNATIRDKVRYFPYRSVKSIFEPEQYLSVLEI